MVNDTNSRSGPAAYVYRTNVIISLSHSLPVYFVTQLHAVLTNRKFCHFELAYSPNDFSYSNL